MTSLSSALLYAESLVGIPYGYWSGNTVPYDDSTPFYLGTGPLPTRDTLRAQGIVCTGLMNLICRHMGLSIPDLPGYPGGTVAWGTRLPWMLFKRYSASQMVPGILLLRRYRDFADQGHLAIVASDGNHLLHSTVDPWNPFEQTCRSPGVTLTELPTEASYYEFQCPPSIWIAALTTSASSMPSEHPASSPDATGNSAATPC